VHVTRASLYSEQAETLTPNAGEPAVAAPHPDDDQVLTALRTLVTTHPTFGYRRLTVLLRSQLKRPINHKRVARLMRQHRWQVTHPPGRPVRGCRSRPAKRRPATSAGRWT
jgi:hypothetical protein